MTTIPPPTAKSERPARGSRASRGVAALELLVVGLLVALQWAGVIKNPSLFVFLLGSIALWLRRSGWKTIGMRRPAGGWSMLAWCAVAAIAYDAFDGWVLLPLFHRITGEPANLSEYQSVAGHLSTVLIWILIGWTIGAFVEELAYRGFAFDRLEELLGRTRTATLVAVLAVSGLFGLIHGYQGISGILDNVFAGLFFALVYLRSGRNLWGSVVAHGMVNTVSFVLLYFGVKMPG